MTKWFAAFVWWRTFVTFVSRLFATYYAFTMTMASANPALKFGYYLALTRYPHKLALLGHDF